MNVRFHHAKFYHVHTLDSLARFWTTYWENQSIQTIIKYTEYSANPIMSSHIRIIREKSNSEWIKLSHKEV